MSALAVKMVTVSLCVVSLVRYINASSVVHYVKISKIEIWGLQPLKFASC